MRRKDKMLITYAVAGGAIIALIEVIRQWLEPREENRPFKLDFRKLATRATIGAGVGAGVGYALYRFQRYNEGKIPFEPDTYLRTLLEGEKLSNDPVYLLKMTGYRDQIKKYLELQYGSMLAGLPADSGSFYKDTANSSNFDIDIVLVFRRASFGSLEEMYQDVFERLNRKFKGRAYLYKSKRAIGMCFRDADDEEYCFDIVPGRAIGEYPTDSRFNLYENKGWIFGRSSYFKTDLSTQRKKIGCAATIRMTRLMKIYRDRNHLELPGVLIDRGVEDTLLDGYYSVSDSDTENFIACLNRFSVIMERSVFKDASNTNNNLLTKLDGNQRSYISRLMQKDVERIENDPRYLREIFDEQN